ncbi:MAG: hypothetical protein ABI743_04090, partial [bacterium]
MLPRLCVLSLLLIAGMLTLGCQGGSSVKKNAHGMPELAAPTGGAPKAVTIPPNLLPPGATPMKTD